MHYILICNKKRKAKLLSNDKSTHHVIISKNINICCSYKYFHPWRYLWKYEFTHLTNIYLKALLLQQCKRLKHKHGIGGLITVATVWERELSEKLCISSCFHRTCNFRTFIFNIYIMKKVNICSICIS